MHIYPKGSKDVRVENLEKFRRKLKSLEGLTIMSVDMFVPSAVDGPHYRFKMTNGTVVVLGTKGTDDNAYTASTELSINDETVYPEYKED